MSEHFKLTNQEFIDNNNFRILEIEADQVVGKNYQDLNLLLKKQFYKLILVEHLGNSESKVRFSRVFKAYKELEEYIEPLKLGKPLTKGDGHYRNGLYAKLNIIEKDGRALALKLVERRNILLNIGGHRDHIRLYALLSPLLATLSLLLHSIIMFRYLSWPMQVFFIVYQSAIEYLIKCYYHQYNNQYDSWGSEISTDEFYSKIGHLQLGEKILVLYPLVSLSIYLLATNFIATGLTVGWIIRGSLVTLALVSGILDSTFVKGCTIYTEKHVRDLLEEDSENRVGKETDLLKWYDLRWLTMPIIMPIIKKMFAGIDSRLPGNGAIDDLNITSLTLLNLLQQDIE